MSSRPQNAMQETDSSQGVVSNSPLPQTFVTWISADTSNFNQRKPVGRAPDTGRPKSRSGGDVGQTRLPAAGKLASLQVSIPVHPSSHNTATSYFPPLCQNTSSKAVHVSFGVSGVTDIQPSWWQGEQVQDSWKSKAARREEASATHLIRVLDFIHGVFLLEVLLGMDPQRQAQGVP